MTTRRPQYLGIAAIALAALAAAGCADHSKSENVDRRAVERWNHLIAHQAEKAYDYLTPGFRATSPRLIPRPGAPARRRPRRAAAAPMHRGGRGA